MNETRRQAMDAAAAVAVLVVCGYAAQESADPAWWQWLMVGAVAAPVAVRRRWPLPAAAVTLAASGAVLFDGVIPGYAAPGLCAAVALTLYSIGAGLPPARSVPALVAGPAGAAALALRWPAAPLATVPAVAVPWIAGWLVRQRRQDAERAFEERTARAVIEERLRIARDMHDIVAHSLSMIAMKASVARHVAGVRPEESATALEVIETSSREALVEMRRAVGLLRGDPEVAGLGGAGSGGVGSGGASSGGAGLGGAGLGGAGSGGAGSGGVALLRTDPEPGQATPGYGSATPVGGEWDLRVLTRRTEEAGVRMEADLAGEAMLPAGVRLVVYRVVQEALTNVVRHAQATRCTVEVEAGAESVTVRVVDDGTAAPVFDGAGHGLRGMRERVMAYGGSLEAGPGADGGFAVTARIPYRARDRGGRG